jgi:alkanesulfonate monooxygenase SsuD/methylene tetrahydromethanopterin reductase-like flavin-dependent oxidoreductase (luciferase family)
MRFGLLFEIQTERPFEDGREAAAWRQAIEQAELAERAGFDAVWAVEHHFLVEYAHCSAPEVFLAAVSQRTNRVRLGHGVAIAPPPVNHPFRLAERIAALDIVSGGRVEAGFGRGFSELEQRGFGLDPEVSRDMALEAVRLLPAMWAEGEFEGAKGRFVDLPARTVIPKPIQRPHPPMWWACTSPASFELAGDNGLGCLCFSFQPPEALGDAIAGYRERARAATSPAGRLVNEQVAGYTVALCLEDREEARRLGGAGYLFNLRRWLECIRPLAELPSHEFYARLLDNPLLEALDEADPTVVGAMLAELGYLAVGEPADCIEVVRRHQALGIDQVLVLMQTGGVPDERVRESIELFGAEVIPACREASGGEASGGEASRGEAPGGEASGGEASGGEASRGEAPAREAAAGSTAQRVV